MKFIIYELEKRFGRKIILSNITYTFESGRVYGIYGEENSGKTVLFDCIRGHIPFKYGTLVYEDDKDDEYVYSTMDAALIHNTPVLPEFMTAFEFIKFFMEINEKRLEGDILPIDTYFDMVGIGIDERYCLIKDLSKDICYKIQIMCLMIMPAKVVLAECPDIESEENKKQIKTFFSILARNSIVIVSGSDEKQIDYYCDEKAVLTDGVLQGRSAYAEGYGNDDDFDGLDGYMTEETSEYEYVKITEPDKATDNKDKDNAGDEEDA